MEKKDFVEHMFLMFKINLNMSLFKRNGVA